MTNIERAIREKLADGRISGGLAEDLAALLADRDQREAALRAERDALAKALAELVACKDLEIAGLHSPEEEDEYFRRKPAAWATARAALAQAKDAEARG